MKSPGRLLYLLLIILVSQETSAQVSVGAPIPEGYVPVAVFDDEYSLRYKHDVYFRITSEEEKIDTSGVLTGGKGYINRRHYDDGEWIFWGPAEANEQQRYYHEDESRPYFDYIATKTDDAKSINPGLKDYEYIFPIYRKHPSPITTTATRRRDTSLYLSHAITVLTRERILAAGCTTIPEALRLVPGLIVREQTNGNFDVHIRGLDNVPPGSTFLLSTNTTTLVMIDGRPVYSYFSGGTFWETLPIDINDVMQIDVIRGATSVLYGPNAGMGVINIVTRTDNFMDNQRFSKRRIYLTGSVSAGYSPNKNERADFLDELTLPGGTLMGSINGIMKSELKSGADLFTGMSLNFQERNRHSDQYFNFGTVTRNPGGQFVPLDSLVYRSDSLPKFQDFPRPDLSLSKYAGNAFMRLHFDSESQIRLSLGGEKSESQKIYSDDQMNPLLRYTSNTFYLDAFWNHVWTIKETDEADIYLIPNVQLSLLSGEQFIGGDVGYEFSNSDLLAELMYEKVKSDNTFWRASVNYNFRWAPYKTTNDRLSILTPDVDTLGNPVDPFERRIRTHAIVGRVEHQFKVINFMLGARYDMFNRPTKNYTSLQAGASVDLLKVLPGDHKNNKWIFRAMWGQAYRAPILTDLYFDQSYGGGVSRVIGVDNLNLLQLRTFDFGMRWQNVTENNATLRAEIELFQVQANDFTDAIVGPNIQEDSSIYSPSVFQNVPLQVRQRGITIKGGGELIRKKLNIDFHLTFQETRLFDYSPYLNEQGDPGFGRPGLIAVPQFGDPPRIKQNTNTEHWQVTFDDTTHLGTPQWIMGLDVTGQIFKRRCRLNGGFYFLSDQTFIHRNESYYIQDDRSIAFMPAKFNAHFKLSWLFRLGNKGDEDEEDKERNLECFFSGRSIGLSLSGDERYLSRPNSEYAWGDQIRAVYMLGIRFEL
ncbi:MAG: TonB-dependent receptor plug domain-containing protein [Bacteroidota bacterium]